MERVTQADIDAAKNGMDSFMYRELIEQRDAQELEDTLQATAGCLIGEVKRVRPYSGTPTACPVEGCSAKFSKDSLCVENESVCLNPAFKPTPKYQ